MKASELMIDDWVKTEGYAHKMSGLQISFMANNSHEHYNEANTEPIPLTEEILKANGFGKNFSERYTKGIVPFEVNIRGNNKYITLGGKHFCNCDYVHELQHALRLCGLKDLADNFKLKKDEQV